MLMVMKDLNVKDAKVLENKGRSPSGSCHRT